MEMVALVTILVVALVMFLRMLTLMMLNAVMVVTVGHMTGHLLHENFQCVSALVLELMMIVAIVMVVTVVMSDIY